MGAVYPQGLYLLVARDAMEGLRDVEKFAAKHHVRSFGFAACDHDKNGVVRIVPVLPMHQGDLLAYVENLNRHPDVSFRLHGQ